MFYNIVYYIRSIYKLLLRFSILSLQNLHGNTSNFLLFHPLLLNKLINNLYRLKYSFQFIILTLISQLGMTLKYSQSQLKTNLIKQNINETTLYYSLVKKQGKTISFISNQRLLIYDNNRKILFYNNDYKSTPFRNMVPKPKNQIYTPIQTSTFKNPNASNQMQVRYTGKNQKGELQTIQWNFICQTQDLAKQWMWLFDDEKNKIVNLATGEKGGAFIHDTLMQAINKNKNKSPPKESILKPQQQIIRQPLQDNNTLNIIQNSRMSRLSNSKKYQVHKEQAKRNSLKQSQFLELPQSLIQKSVARSRSKNYDESRVFIQESRTKKFQIESEVKYKQPSIIKPKQESIVKKQKSNYEDWNQIFLRHPHESTILQFKKAAINAFQSIWQRDSNVLSDMLRVYDSSQGLTVSVCNCFTEQARNLKRQFRNYHFIMQSCKAKLVVGVPLCCLIQWQGVVALVKAPIPQQSQQIKLARTLPQIRQLQRYTRVNNSILQKATLYDTTDIYGMNGDRKLIFIDHLVQYLPMNTDETYSKSSLRPDFLLDSVNQIVPGGEVKPVNRIQWKILNGVCEEMQKSVGKLVTYLNNQQYLWSHALELKQIFHQFGVNLKYLPRVYSQLSNKHVKKYIQTVMAAKTAKELVYGVLLQARRENNQANAAKLVEECLRKFIQGQSNSSSEIWKDLSIRFKKIYGIPFNNTELIGGIFFNSLIRLLRISCDMNKLNRTKKIFKEQGIVSPGFVLSIEPKAKIYNRFTTEFIQKIKYACKQQKKDIQIYDQIVSTLHLQNSQLPDQYAQGQAQQCILQYLSYYTPPKSIDSNVILRNIAIYNDIFKESPSAFTLKLTRTYLNWCIKKDKVQQFKRGMENALKIADYWLEETHLYHCSLYELLSDFYASLGNGQESINFMKQALSRCIRICGAQSKQAGIKYYQLGERQLKVGHKKSALQNFTKAKINMESNKNDTIKYPQLLMRLSALHLNHGNIEGCIEGALQAIRQFEEYDKRSNNSIQTQAYKIKTFQVLSRAFQISGKKEDLKQMAQLCAKKFNRSKSDWTFQQMLRICTAAVICRNSTQKCQNFTRFLKKTIQQQRIDESTSLKQLMLLSESMIVMQRFITRFQHIEKILAQGNSKRGYTQDSKEFALICRYLVACIGQDYIEGLVQQKQYE